jgi:hypothetical protein
MLQQETQPRPHLDPASLVFVASTGLPDDWDEQLDRAEAELGASAPTSLRARWITLAQARMPRPLHTFALRCAEQDRTDLAFAITGGLLREPGDHPRFDPHMILSGQSTAVGIAPDGPHVWRAVDPPHVMPCCLLMFPNYETVPAGRSARDPGAAEAFVDRLTEWAAGAGARSVVALYVREDHPELLDALGHAGFALVPMAEQHLLPVTWADFDGYLRTLPAKRRRTIQRECRELDAAGVSIVERPLRDDEPELVRLRCNLVMKYGGVPSEPNERATFAHLRTHFGADDLLVVEARQAGTLVNFALFVRDGRQWTALLTGTAYGARGARLAYFATMYYRPAAIAPGFGVHTISYGMGAGEAKRLRGCIPRRLFAAARLIR